MNPQTATTTQAYADVEVRIYSSTSLQAEINSDGGVHRAALGPFPEADLQASLKGPPRAYGTLLYQWLFGSGLERALKEVQWSVEQGEGGPDSLAGIRLRLWIDPQAQAAVQAAQWETLFDPRRQAPLVSSALFSRFLRSRAPRHWALDEPSLKVILLAADSSDLQAAGRGELPDELEEQLRSASKSRPGGVSVQRIQGREPLTNLAADMMEGSQIVHLVTPGFGQSATGPVTFAESEDDVSAETLQALSSAIVGGMKRPPSLVCLMVEPRSARYALGMRVAPVLVDAGAYAVVAFQGTMRPECMRLFSRRLYEVLLQTGLIDLAVAEARAELLLSDRESWDWALPVLYMRTPDGRLFQQSRWAMPRFRGEI